MAKEKIGGEAAEESRGAAAREEVCIAREEYWTSGATEKKEGLSCCSIAGEAVRKVF
jgi:hypothetical protein